MNFPFKMKSKQTLVFDFNNINSGISCHEDNEGDGITAGNFMIYIQHKLCKSFGKEMSNK